MKVALNKEVDAWVLLDTGSTGGLLLDRDMVTPWGWLRNNDVSEETIQGVVARGETNRFVLHTLGFGPFELGNVEANVPVQGEDFVMFEEKSVTGSHIPRNSSAERGLLGYEVLKHFVITLDYKGAHVHIATSSES